MYHETLIDSFHFSVAMCKTCYADYFASSACGSYQLIYCLYYNITTATNLCFALI